MISLIVPSYKNPTYLDLCLDTALKGSDDETDYEIISVIDGFVEMYNDVFEKYKFHDNVKFLKFKQNHGLQYALNNGVWQANNKRIFIINEDNVVGNNWNTRVSDVYDKDTVYTLQQIEPGVDVPVGFDFYQHNFGTNVENFNYEAFIEFEDNHVGNKETEKGGLFPFVMSKKQYMIVGGFDLWYQSPHICDNDFFTKLELNGLDFKRSYWSFVYHFGQKSTKKREDDPTAEQKFLKKESAAAKQYAYKWGWQPTRGKNNSNLPNRNNIKGIDI